MTKSQVLLIHSDLPMSKIEGNAKFQLGVRENNVIFPQMFTDHQLLPPDLRQQIKNPRSSQKEIFGNRLR